MSNFGIKAYDEEGNELLHYLNSCVIDVITHYTPREDIVYEIPSYCELIIIPVYDDWEGIESPVTLLGNKLIWNRKITNDHFTVIVMCKGRK